MDKAASGVLTEARELPVPLHGWRKLSATGISYVKLGAYLAAFGGVFVVDKLSNLVLGRQKRSFDKFDEMQ
jgi:drug/metabolite transporter superfamily protein YnfA